MTSRVSELQQPLVVTVGSDSRDERSSLVSGSRSQGDGFGTFSRIRRKVSDYFSIFGALRPLGKFPRECMIQICSFLSKEDLALDIKKPVVAVDDQAIRRHIIAEERNEIEKRVSGCFSAYVKYLEGGHKEQSAEKDRCKILAEQLEDRIKYTYEECEGLLKTKKAKNAEALTAIEGKLKHYEAMKLEIPKLVERLIACHINESFDDEMAAEIFDTFCLMHKEDVDAFKNTFTGHYMEQIIQKAIDAAAIHIANAGGVDSHVIELVNAGFLALAIHFTDPAKPPLQFDVKSLKTYYYALSAYAEKHQDRDRLSNLFQRMNAVGQQAFLTLPVDALILFVINSNTQKIMNKIASKIPPALLNAPETKALVNRCTKMTRESFLSWSAVVLSVIAFFVLTIGLAISVHCSHYKAVLPHPEPSSAPNVSSTYHPTSAPHVVESCHPDYTRYKDVITSTVSLLAVAYICYKKTCSYMDELRTRWS